MPSPMSITKKTNFTFIATITIMLINIIYHEGKLDFVSVKFSWKSPATVLSKSTLHEI